MRNVRIFAGRASTDFAAKMCADIGVPLCPAELGNFSDGEIKVQLKESVRGMKVVFVQSLYSDPVGTPDRRSVNDYLMELLLMIDAAKRGKADSITLVIPYIGYARQDRKVKPRVPISASVVMNLLKASGAKHIITVDVHADQIQGFVDIPVDNLYAGPVLREDMKSWIKNKKKTVAVTPDNGGTSRARAFAERLEIGLALIDKRREQENVSEVMNVIGKVAGMDCALIDDMFDTAGTICNAAVALKENGAKRISASGTHAVLSGPALKRIEKSPIEVFFVTDTIPLSPAAIATGKFRVVEVHKLVAEAVEANFGRGSLSSLFKER